MKILIAGDTHGNSAWWSRLVEYARKRQCATIVQLGDFGYWEHTVDGRLFLDRLSKKLVRAGVRAYFIDGNHENHPLLWEQYPPDEDGFCEVRPSLYYIPRGHSFTWDGVKFLGLGGAYSVDVKWRLDEEAWRHAPRTLWWPTETLTTEEVERACAVGKVDVLLSHDCPWGVTLPGIGGEFIESNLNRMMVSRVVRETLPDLVLHGHYHMRNSGSIAIPYAVDGELVWHNVIVEGYHCDGAWDQQAWAVFDTEEYLHSAALAAA